MANTVIIYQGDGSTTDFAVPFDYLRKTFVRVFIDSSTELTGGSSSNTSADYYFLDSTTIRLRKIVPTSAQTITIRRYTSVTERVASFRDGSVLYATDLDTSQLQAFHIAEEARDILYDSLSKGVSGDWDAKGNRILNVSSPITDTDAATKEYVDTVAGVQKKLTDLEATTLQYKNEAESFRDESLANATTAKASAGTAVSAMNTTVAYTADVTSKHTEVLNNATQVAKDAKEVASNTSEVYQNTKQVEQDKAVVIDAKNVVLPIVDSVEQIKVVAENIDSVNTDAGSIYNINLVGSDLEGSLVDSTYDDYGTLGDDTPKSSITGGNIKIVADNIDALKVVAGLAPDFETAINSVETVTALTNRAETAATKAEEYAREKQVDWDQTDTTQMDYIKNKPDVATKDYVDKAYDDYGELN